MITLDTRVLARFFLNYEPKKPKQFEALCYAVLWYEQGLDFGDALHLALSAAEQAFCTFDKKLTKSAADMGAIP